MKGKTIAGGFKVGNTEFTLFSTLSFILGGGLLVAGLATLVFLHPFTTDVAKATSATSEASIKLEPDISAPVINPSEVTITLEPEASSSFSSANASVDVSTNNPTGYTLTMSTDNTTNSLNLGGDTSATEKMTTLTNETTLADFQSTTHQASLNKWGFTTDNNGSTTDPTTGTIIADHYLPVPNNASARTIKVTTSHANTSITNVTYATKVDRDLPAGAYSNTIVFSATANPLPPKTLKRVTTEAGITTMQGLTSSVCSSADTWQTGEEDAILTDPRDNSTYVVRKLADGNCWMVENLNLSAESLTSNNHSTTLDSSDTDLASGTFTVPATSNTNWGGYNYSVAPKIATSAQSGYTDYGMYYNWWAATARTTDITTAEAVAPDSICPKGWNLPTGNTNNQWYQLFDAYKSAYGWTNINNGSGNDMSKVNTTNLLSNDTVGPNLQFSGYWNYSGTAPYSQSSAGRWWSSTVVNEANSYYANVFSSGYVSGGMNILNKRYGFSVRCMFPAGS